MIRIAALRMLALLIALITPTLASAQSDPLTFATIERPPFAFQKDEEVVGFSIELMQAISEEIGRDVEFVMTDAFSDMLGRVSASEVDGAVANISITADRERVMDFSLPFFESGLQIMVTGDADEVSIFSAVLTKDILIALLWAAVALFSVGMLMWVFERKKQPYFDRPIKEALFPSFWWALNLVVNGGFEERMPRSGLGRLFSVVLVVSSLFVVSIFVAQVTAALTVGALTSRIESINDLDRNEVATTEGSTASAFLTARDVRHRTVENFGEMIDAMDVGEVDAVFFDGPLLRYHLQKNPDKDAHIVNRVFKAENYGIALPTASPLREPINQALLLIQESGDYDKIYSKWFGEN